MKIICILIICSICLLSVDNNALFAGGDLIKLKNLGDNMALQEQALKKEADAYKKAETFINSPEIRQGLLKEDILKRCGEPVARVRDDQEWVYKPTSSTFFKGEKIYLVFDQEDKLISWQKVNQQ